LEQIEIKAWRLQLETPRPISFSTRAAHT